MHLAYLGVTKKLIKLWFSSQYHDQQFSLHRFKELVDNSLMGITPPGYVARLPRRITDVSNWKAAELKYFLLYYSLPILSDIMEDEYFAHHTALVLGIYYLNQSSISARMIREAEEALVSYVSNFERLYGKRHMSINVHALLHLPQVVRRLGPLWATSCFPFENANGFLKKFVHGTRHAELQICSNLSLFTGLKNLKNQVLLHSSPATKFCEKLDAGKKFRRKSVQISPGAWIIGKYVKIEMTGEIDMPGFVHEEHPISVYKFYKLLQDERVYTGEQFQTTSKTDSSCVRYKLNDAQDAIGIIQYFLRVSHCDCNTLCVECNYYTYAVIL